MNTTQVQYGECMYVPGTGGAGMPFEVRERLFYRAQAVSQALGYPMVQHDFLWIDPKCQPNDPLGQRATAGIRYYLDVPTTVVNAQRDARIKAEGWVPLKEFRMPDPTGDLDAPERVEIADFHFDGVPRRYARVRKEA